MGNCGYDCPDAGYTGRVPFASLEGIHMDARGVDLLEVRE